LRETSAAREVTAGERAHALDALRALAAFGVMLFHFWVYTEPLPPGASPHTLGERLFESARWGLFLFFVLSGFLLYRPWVRAALAGRERPRVRRYLRLRAARIAPAYYLALAGAGLIALVGSAPPMRLPTHGTWPLFLVFGENFSDHSLNSLDSPMWTLPIEVSFYLVLPLLGLAALRLGKGRRRQAVVGAGLVAIGVAWAQLATGLWLQGAVLPQMIPFFAFGMMVAVAIEGRSLSRRLCRWLVAGAVAAYLVNLALDVWAPPVSKALEDMPVAAGFACLVAVGAAGEWVPRLLRTRFVVWMGVVSYGTYLWHQPLMCLLGANGLLPRNLLVELPIVLPLTLAVAWASWHFVEHPVLRWAHRRGAERRPATRPQPAGARADLPRPVPALIAPRPA
jgi:peptidoglycan/LPS O-acetylase OafA/YrhL